MSTPEEGRWKFDSAEWDNIPFMGQGTSPAITFTIDLATVNFHGEERLLRVAKLLHELDAELKHADPPVKVAFTTRDPE